MLEAFGVERLARSAPSTILAIGVGVLAYVPAFLITLTLAVQVGLIWP